MNTQLMVTDLEKITFNALIDLCMEAPEADVTDLSEFTGLTKDSIKGIVGSLVKKGLVVVGEDQRDYTHFKTINPIVDGDALSFGCDYYEESEVEGFKL